MKTIHYIGMYWVGVERAKKIPARAEPSQYTLSNYLARAGPSQSRLSKVFGSSQNEPQKVQLEPKRANIFIENFLKCAKNFDKSAKIQIKI